MPVYVAQLKCPNNHCVLGAVRDYPDDADAAKLGRELRSAFDDAVSQHLMNPWCGLCGSRTLNIHLGATAWQTMDEAMPAMRELERRQLETARYLKQANN